MQKNSKRHASKMDGGGIASGVKPVGSSLREDTEGLQ